MIAEFNAQSTSSSETNQRVDSVSLFSAEGQYVHIGERLLETGQYGLYCQLNGLENTAEDCIESIHLDRTVFALRLRKPIKNFSEFTEIRAKLDMPDMHYAHLVRTMKNLFSRYPSVLSINA